MSTSIFRARQMSLALLVVGVIDHGSLNIDCSGAAPTSLGLVRLGRDLMRRSGGDNMAAPASGLTASRRFRAHSSIG
jgi:hypothetical protein